MDDVAVLYATDDELGVVATLRWQWAVQENDRTPATSREEFVRAFADWAREHASTHRWIIASCGGEIIGMACLAIVPRVPSPQSPDRASGDLQSVYVVPGKRSTGLGGQIVTAILRLADQLGLERVTFIPVLVLCQRTHVRGSWSPLACCRPKRPFALLNRGS